MKREEAYLIVSSVLLVMVINTAVNLSDNLYMGIRHPEIYFPTVIIGLVLSIIIQIYGSYKLIEWFNKNLKKRQVWDIPS